MLRYVRRFLRMYQGFVLSGGILFFGAIAFFFAVFPGVGATRDLYDTLQALGKETDVLSGKLAFLNSLREEDLRGRLVTVLSAVPQEKSVPTIFSTIEGLANQSGVSVIDMSLMSPGSLATIAATSRLSTTEKKIGASTLSFSLTASGNYSQIRAFVGKMNKIRRLFDVTNFDLSIGPAGVTQARVSLSAFYQPIPSKVGSVGALVSALSQKEEEALASVSRYEDVSGSSLEALTPIIFGGKRDPFAR